MDFVRRNPLKADRHCQPAQLPPLEGDGWANRSELATSLAGIGQVGRHGWVSWSALATVGAGLGDPFSLVLKRLLPC